MTDSLIGIELLLRCFQQDIKKKEDVLLLLVHHSLLKAGFKCAGNGEKWNNNDTLSEFLPNEWNTSEAYTLRYKRDEDKYILMSNRTDDIIVFNFTCAEKMKVTNVIFNIDESVNSVDGNISAMVPMYENAVHKITQQLITPFAVTQKIDTNTQTTEDRPSKVKIIPEPAPHSSRDLRNDIYYSDVYFNDLNSVGRRDLDPLVAMGGGGGMLFDPLRENRSRLLSDIGMPQRLPRGAVPPRARFDPFGPPDNDIHGRPPPGYDDMFG